MTAGGTRLEDIELQRQDEARLDVLGAEIIPDPTTAGDFLRRFGETDIIELMAAINTIRKRAWNKQPNASSPLESSQWIDRSLDLVGDTFEEVWIRGNTDFSLTEHFDKWCGRKYWHVCCSACQVLWS